MPQGHGDPRRVAGREPPRLRHRLNNLAVLYQAMGDYAQGRAAATPGAGDPEERRWARTTPTTPPA